MARLNHVASFRGTTKTDDGNLTCGKCRDKIKPGDSYRWWANRAPGQRGSFRNIRCAKSECTPSIADRTPGRRGQLYGIQEAFAKENTNTFTEASDFESLAESYAEEVRSLGEEITEAADNIESGFGHETSQSEELRERGDEVISQAEEIASVDIDEPDYGETDEDLTPDEIAEANEMVLSDWRAEQLEKIMDALDQVEV